MSGITVKPTRGVLDPAWSVEDAAQLYSIDAWGKGYFGINAAGHVTVRPNRSHEGEIDLMDVISGLRERRIYTPVMLRFGDVLAHRFRDIHEAFANAIEENEYQGAHCAVFPIKVNQQRYVVEEVYDRGHEYGFGLEVGSKPELLAVLGMTSATPERLIICNGFKDDQYIETVILAAKLGRHIIPVAESVQEIRLIVKYAEKYGVRPEIGMRVKLASQGIGRWGSSAGARSKFGLFVSEILEAVEMLRERNLSGCLALLHCHIGSQIHDIRRIKNAIDELGHVYTELVRLGTGLKYLDVGGGLGVDYDGSQTNFESSMNYTLVEYASDVVYRVMSVCDDAEVAHPTIVTECGRAMVAFHSLLVFNVLGASGLSHFKVPESLDGLEKEHEEIPQPIYDLFEAYQGISERRLIESFHDAIHARDEALNLFNLGYMNLALRGLAEQMFWAICSRLRQVSLKQERQPEEFEQLEIILSDIYFCNFSLFQSIPDSWAVDQVFPIMPLHRLNEKPVNRGVLADITCDSDGKIDRFADIRDVKKTLELHPLNPDEEYYLGAFLVGAYQETLGDLHNLFGDPHVVHIGIDADGHWQIDEMVEGDSVREVLQYMEYDVGRLFRAMRRDCERAVRRKLMTVGESQALLQFYGHGLDSYTYLEPND